MARAVWPQRWAVVVATCCFCAVGQQDIWLTSIQPFTGNDWDAGVSMRIGAEILLEEVNNHSTLLNGYDLKVVWQDGLCSKSTGTNLFMQNIFDQTYEVFAPGVALADLDADGDGRITTADTAPLSATWNTTTVNPAPVGLLGSGCSGTALNIAATAYHARWPMISNSATRPALSDRSEYPNFFRTILPDSFFNNAWVAMVRMLSIDTFTSVVGETENWGSMGEGLAAAAQSQGVSMRGLDLTSEIAGFYGVQVGSDSQAAAKEAALEFVRMKERIIVLLMFASRIRLVLCEAHKLGFRNGVYMVFGWFANGWWEVEDTDCSAAQITEQATGYISANMMFWRTDRDTVLSCSESMTAGEFVEEWFDRQGADYGDLSMRPEGYAPALEAATTADAVCMFAQMLHEVLLVRGVSLADLAQRTDAAYAEVFDVLSNTDFEGVQGRVRFEPGEADPKGSVTLQQLHAGGTICDVASYNHPTMSFLGQCDLVFGYPGETFEAGPAGAASISAQLTPFASCPSTQVLNMSTNTCEDCPAGQVFVQLFGTCVCQAGFVPSSTVEGDCEPCQPGNYTSATGSEVCSACQPGWFSSSAGSTECETCPLGTFSGQLSASVCMDCPVHMTTAAERSLNETYCDCEVGRYRPRGSQSCQECLEGMECEFASAESNFVEFGGNNINVPMVLERYFTEASAPLSVFQCRQDDVCTGGLPQSCFGDVIGFMCSRCPGSAVIDMDVPRGCDECSGMSAALLVLPPFVGIGIIIATYYLSNGQLKVQATVSLTASISVGMALTILQVFSILNGLNIPWPKSSRNYFSSLRFLMLDVGALSIECSVGVDATSNYLAQILVPFAMVILLGLCFVASGLIARSLLANPERAWDLNKVVNTGGQLSQALFIVFAVIFVRPFECYPHPNDESSVFLFPEVLCWSGDHTPLVVLAFVVLIFFLLPFLVACIWGNLVAPKHMLREGSTFHVRFRFLLYRFRPDCWWWGNVFLMRQTFLSFSSSLPSGDPHSQIFYTVLTLTVYLAAESRLWPWKNAMLNRMDCTGCLLLIFVMLSGTAFVERSPAQKAYVILLSMFIIMKWVVLAGMCALVVYTFFRVGAFEEFAVSQRKKSEATKELSRALRVVAKHIVNMDEVAIEARLNGMNAFDRSLLTKAALAWAYGSETLTRSGSALSSSTVSSRLSADHFHAEVEEKARPGGHAPPLSKGYQAPPQTRGAPPCTVEPMRDAANPKSSTGANEAETQGTMLLAEAPGEHPAGNDGVAAATSPASSSGSMRTQVSAPASPGSLPTAAESKRPSHAKLQELDFMEIPDIGEESTSMPKMSRAVVNGASCHGLSRPRLA